ncbi:MAG: efflux RND transporter periplasmic adaptor subunit [Gemmatimonadaceae bacterium]|nr:efflux RND transporter periplasmic adaptor subunit [Gemmatimonadaceae bacterium]
MKKLVVALAFISALGACRKDKDDEAKVDARIPVKVTIAQMQSISETIGGIGTVTARPGFVASLTAPAQARVLRIAVSQGQPVVRGQALVLLDPLPFQTASQGAQASLNAAQRAYDRAQRLVAAGIAPRKDLEQAATDLALARGAASTAQRTQALSTLRSPLDGSVTRLNAILGSFVDANQQLVEVTDTRALDLILTTTPANAAKIHNGALVRLAAGQSASGEALGSGSVASVSALVDSASRGVAIKVRAPSTLRPLRVGETFFGEIAVGTHAAVTVPVEALVPEGDQFKVFVVDASGIAHARPVTVGARTGALAEIKSGLSAGEKVVTYGAYGVEDSAKVIVGK